MRPVPSIILFTVTSGLGLGLFAVAALASLADMQPLAGRVATALTGFATVTVGLVSSTFHLANKRNAWRSLARLRTSWLSREAVLALAFYPVAAAWLWRGGAALALATAALALGVVFTTGMIYACLRTVRQWYTALTPLLYLSAALALGAMTLNAITVAAGPSPALLAPAAALLTALALAVKLAWYQHAGAPNAVSAEQATGLTGGAVRLLDPGHTAGTYLTREFLFELGARRARALRAVALVLGYLLPIALLLAAGDAFAVAATALLTAYAGMLVERWLFFAEATHVVSLYHGARQA